MIRRRRPTAAVFFGVTNIVVGALGLMFYGCSGLMVVALTIDPADTIWPFVAGDVRIFTPMAAAHFVLSLLICLLLLIAGLGLLGLHNWGRLVSIVCGVLALVLNVWNIIFQVAFVSPSMQRYVNTALHPMLRSEKAAQSAFVNVCVIGAALLAILYSIALLITLLLPDVAATFHQKPQPEWDEDFDEDDRPRPRRRRSREDDDWND
jgi:hypothetical protein